MARVEENEKWWLTRRAVAEQVALLVGSYPNALPHSPEVYTRMLVEEILAADTDAHAGMCGAT
jgi:hypothetical protein